MNYSLIQQRNPRNPIVQGAASFNWSTLDGSLNAPAGAAQYPTLLNPYGGTASRNKGLIGGVQYQPPWSVAAIDYRVGCPAGQSLTTVTNSFSQSGVSVDTVDKILLLTGTNVVLDSLDCATNSWRIEGTSGNGAMIDNSTFRGPDPIYFDQTWTGGATVKNCTIDGNSQAGSFKCLVTFQGSGDFVAEYNQLKNSYSDNFDIGGGTNFRIRYNEMENNAQGDASIHGDWMQILGGGPFNFIIDFNTVYMTTLGGLGSSGTQGFWLGCNPGPIEIDSASNSYNTILLPSGSGLTQQAFLYTKKQIDCQISTHDNYMDLTAAGTGGAFDQTTAGNAGAFSPGTVLLTNNIDMNTGSLVHANGLL